MEEQWKKIDGYENLYLISNKGLLKSLRKNSLLKPYETKQGYLIATLYKDGVKQRISIHRLVAKAFVENPENKEQVHHINHDPKDNRSLNLEWCTASENIKYNYSTGGQIGKSNMKGRFGKNNPTSIEVRQLDLEGNLIKIHTGISEAARAVKGSASHITKVCKGKLKKHKNYRWEYN
jgi:hypothetical protein